jgi:hypothetical protein
MTQNLMRPELAQKFFLLDPAGRLDPQPNPKTKWGSMPGGRSGVINRISRRGPNGYVGRVAGTYNAVGGCWYVSHERVLYRAEHIIELLKAYGELPPPEPIPGVGETYTSIFNMVGEPYLRLAHQILMDYGRVAEQLRAAAERKGDAAAERSWRYKAHAAHQLVEATELTSDRPPHLEPPTDWI